MDFQKDPNVIRWKTHLKSPPQAMYQTLATDQGRASFWAETAIENAGTIHFVFPNHAEWKGRILEADPPWRFKVEYYGSGIATFELESDGSSGTDVTFTDQGIAMEDRTEVLAGWVSVLLALKASVDFGIDLRNHDPRRSWDEGYAEN